MKIQQWHYSANQWKNNFTEAEFDQGRAHLVLPFGESALSINPEIFNTLKNRFPHAQIVTLSSLIDLSCRLPEGWWDSNH